MGRAKKRVRAPAAQALETVCANLKGSVWFGCVGAGAAGTNTPFFYLGFDVIRSNAGQPNPITLQSYLCVRYVAISGDTASIEQESRVDDRLGSFLKDNLADEIIHTAIDNEYRIPYSSGITIKIDDMFVMKIPALYEVVLKDELGMVEVPEEEVIDFLKGR